MEDFNWEYLFFHYYIVIARREKMNKNKSRGCEIAELRDSKNKTFYSSYFLVIFIILILFTLRPLEAMVCFYIYKDIYFIVIKYKGLSSVLC